ncbi:aminotransferase class I/II-fold pyridoxal phosphate-dependent enzyme [Ornithinibacillus halophilus]|uniref:Lysine decarboxylase n=1 Tax=Ornithinibacillus halophilus TaxID=930117 RepID=A0A1M5MF74_9BACI|nr:aminotransferase class I/II-fold pyridoxal phosphate-dependent enzyme [Ornithinibacillus halophilus]SHG76018.1 lysine decarboxylase [Ornithinibacillus halophilus]
MNLEQKSIPLYEKLREFSQRKPLSFHVPGHKNGLVFPDVTNDYFKSILPIDLTELSGLDDLHAPDGVIKEAEQLAADFFRANHSYFLVGGSTVGNLAMILATCSEGDELIVQRNSHKSIMNGLELCDAMPIYVSPEYDEMVNRYTAPSMQTIEQAIKSHPNAKAIVLTYPDYFGSTYAIKEIINKAHQHNIPVLVDEAHGVHFSLGAPFPTSALDLGADIVVQSAHKMGPAMTMASFLHINSSLINPEAVEHYLQMLQSSSPSYPLMASLDLARYFLANLTVGEIDLILESVSTMKELFDSPHWKIIEGNDPLKITLQIINGQTGFDVAKSFESQGIYPELATTDQVLFIHGLGQIKQWDQINKALKTVNEQLIYMGNHATIDTSMLFSNPVERSVLTFKEIKKLRTEYIPLANATGRIAAEAIIPYPPGIPMLIKGEEINTNHVKMIQHLLKQGANFQHRNIDKGIQVFQEKE